MVDVSSFVVEIVNPGPQTQIMDWLRDVTKPREGNEHVRVDILST